MSVNTTSRLISFYRIVAFVEALSWVGLLIAMYFKHILHDHTYIIPAGMLHGIVFITFVVSSVIVAQKQKWTSAWLLGALFSAFPPLCSAVFEVIAHKKGKLTPVVNDLSPR